MIGRLKAVNVSFIITSEVANDNDGMQVEL
jgi:hypothetical protein